MSREALSEYRSRMNAKYYRKHHARVLVARKVWNAANAAYKADNRRKRRAELRQVTIQ